MMDSKLFIVGLLFICGCVAPPVTKTKENETTNEDPNSDGLENYMEYHRYLREVVNALESDPDFKKKLEQASEDDIRSGKIAHELEFVNHHIRTRLDELKRMELERLRQLTEKKNELLENNILDDPTHHHLDRSNPHTFEIHDLKKLIAKTTEDLAEADRKRRDEFKEYELQKEYEKQDKLNHTNGDERIKLENDLKEKEEKHKNHDRLHEPGHKQQLEEVWEEQDRMQQDFDPKIFFMLHDLDSNGLWDQTEVKALFIKELDKMYQAGAPEDDMRERAEEMERMREAVFREVDTNKDGFIDYNEFLAQTKRNEFQQDHGWQGIDEQKPFTEEEFEEYIRQYKAQQAAYQQHMPPPGMGHPGQVPPGMQHPGQVPPGYYPPHGNQIPSGGNNAGGYYPPPHPQVQAGQMPPPQYVNQQQGGQVPQQYLNQQQAAYVPQQQQPQQFVNQQAGQLPQQPQQFVNQQAGHLPQQQINQPDVHDQKFRQEQVQKLLPNDINKVQNQQIDPKQYNIPPQQNIQPQQQNIQHQKQNIEPQQQNIQPQQQNIQHQQQNIQPQQPNIQPQQPNIQPQQQNINPQQQLNQQPNIQQQQHPNNIVNDQGIKHR